MAFNNDASSLQYHIFKDYNLVMDETKNSYLSLRKVQWVKEGETPNEDKAKLELRKITVTNEGERTLKGFSFSTPNGPNDLVEGMLKCGFGSTKECLKSLADRSDFKSTLENINKNDDESNSTNTLFDMRDLLYNIESDMEEE